MITVLILGQMLAIAWNNETGSASTIQVDGTGKVIIALLDEPESLDGSAIQDAGDEPPSPQEPGNQQDTETDAAQAEDEDAPKPLELTGTLVPRDATPVKLGFRVWRDPTVVEAAAHGATVGEGETLLVLDAEDLEHQLQDRRVALHNARLALQQAERELMFAQRLGELDVQAAEIGLQHSTEDLARFLEIDLPAERENVQFNVEQANYQVEYATEELEQLRRMYRQDHLTEETEEIILRRAERDVMTRQHILARAERTAERTLEFDLPRRELQMTEAKERAEITLKRRQLSLPADMQTKQIEVERRSLEVAKLERELERFEDDAARATVTAPAAGIVCYGNWTHDTWSGVAAARQSLVSGGRVNPNDVLITIISPESRLIVARLPEAELHRVEVGIEATATPVGRPDLELPVRLESISLLPVEPGSFECRFEIVADELPRGVVPAMNCKIIIGAREADAAAGQPPASDRLPRTANP